MTRLLRVNPSHNRDNDQNLNAAERLFESVRPAPIINDYQREQLAIHANHKRLKAERLAREATPT